MKNTFSIQRFAALLRRDWALGQKAWTKMFVIMGSLTAAILFGILNLMWLSSEIKPEDLDNIFRQMSIATFVGILTIGGSVSASLAFEDLHDRGRGIQFLMLPATVFEKWAAAFLQSFVLYGGLAFAAFSVANFLSVTAFCGQKGLPIPTEAMTEYLLPASLFTAFKTYLFVHAIYFLGSAWFKKSHWMNTTLWVIGFVVMFGLAQDAMPNLLLGSGVDLKMSDEKWFAYVEDDGFFNLPVSNFWFGATKVIELVAVPFFWFLSFLRLREREI